MIDNSDQVVEESHGTPGWVTAAIVILAIVSIAGLGLAWHNSTELQQAQQSFSGQIKTISQNDSQQVAALEEKLTQANTTSTGLQSDLGVVEKRLRVTQSDLKKAREDEAKIREEREADVQKLAQMDTDVKTQLATKATTDDLNTVNGSVNNVKTDLEGTKNDLKMARSELGTLIARNHEEIDVLRRMGERDYVEFTINGKNKPQKVGAITIELRSVDTKKNKFTVALTVDDNRTEKKDRLVDEPVVFYPRGSHQADEFVVNSVAKDKISGYISVPKNPPATTANASGG
jgi:predicted negative regulator of RcsB-dependent stress response